MQSSLTEEGTGIRGSGFTWIRSPRRVVSDYYNVTMGHDFPIATAMSCMAAAFANGRVVVTGGDSGFGGAGPTYLCS